MKVSTSNKAIIIVFAVIIALALLATSCCGTSDLCKPHYGDGKITRVTEKEVWTKNYLGYEIPHRISRGDSTVYVVGEILIFNR